MIDEGTITVEAIMEPRIYRPQFDVTYSYVTPKIELDGQELAGLGQLDARTARASQAGTIKNAKIAGMSCKPSGQLNDDVTLSFDTDGLTMSLNEKTKSVSTATSTSNARAASAMSMRPQATRAAAAPVLGRRRAEERPASSSSRRERRWSSPR